MAQVVVERAVQVICDRGTEVASRYSAGSGYLVGGTRVLTAAHTLHEGKRVLVRTSAGEMFEARQLPVRSRLDVAVLEVTDVLFEGPPPSRYGRVDRDSDREVQGCSLVGFPRFKQGTATTAGIPVCDTAYVQGEIVPKANLPTRELEFRVSGAATPEKSGQIGGSQWTGMSGAVVRARYPGSDDVALGVITTHSMAEGTRIIRAVAISELVHEPELCEALGLASDDMRLLPCETDESSPYWATVADLHRRTPVLLDREDALRQMAEIARGSDRYVWLVGDKWSGKTALQAHFAIHSPDDVDRLTYFLSNRTDADSQRFVAVLNDQLARLLGESIDVSAGATGPVDLYRRRWEQAVKRSEREERHLLLVVDGLDDDISADRDLPSVASLLPRLTSERTHVVVTTRHRPQIPADVDVSHPIYDAVELKLSHPSQKVRERMREIERRHKLCPICKLSDEAESVRTIGENGIWASSQRAETFRVGTSLQFPHPLGGAATPGFGKWLFGLVALTVLWAVTSSVAEGGDSSEAPILLAFAAVGIGLVVVSSMASNARRREAERVRAKDVWNKLWYCRRDGAVYWPEVGQPFAPRRLRWFLYDSEPIPTADNPRTTVWGSAPSD